jgi:hypothetical protein
MWICLERYAVPQACCRRCIRGSRPRTLRRKQKQTFHFRAAEEGRRRGSEQPLYVGVSFQLFIKMGYKKTWMVVKNSPVRYMFCVFASPLSFSFQHRFQLSSSLSMQESRRMPSGEEKTRTKGANNTSSSAQRPTDVVAVCG